MNQILFFVIVICIANFLIFLFISNSSIYTFNLDLFLKEPWRLFTFQFFHTNLLHLLENFIGFTFIAFVATELEIDFKSFLFVYFSSIFVVVLPILYIFPTVTVAGNSTGIYGLLALCLIKARKLVSLKITIPVIIVSIFSFSVFNFFVCGMCFIQFFKSEFLHFTGFLSGVILYFFLKQNYLISLHSK